MTHEVESHPGVFEARWTGYKPWEFRKNDRGYQPRDFLHEREWNPVTERYTGRSILSRITLIYRGDDKAARKFGIPKGYCIMTVQTIAQGAEEFVGAKEAM